MHFGHWSKMLATSFMAATCVGVFGSGAQANMVTYSFAGVWDGSSTNYDIGAGGIFHDIQAGDQFSGTIKFDNSAANAFSAPHFTYFTPILTTFVTNGHSFEMSADSGNSDIYGTANGNSSDHWIAINPSGASDASLDGTIFNELDITLNLAGAQDIDIYPTFLSGYSGTYVFTAYVDPSRTYHQYANGHLRGCLRRGFPPACLRDLSSVGLIWRPTRWQDRSEAGAAMRPT